MLMLGVLMTMMTIIYVGETDHDCEVRRDKKDWSVESGGSKSIIYLKPVSNM